MFIIKLVGVFQRLWAGILIEDLPMKSREDRIATFLLKRFPNNRIAPTHFGGLLNEYVASGLAPPHVLEELETGDDGKLWSIVWESILYRHLSDFDYKPRNRSGPTGQNGPDFCFDHGGKTIWIEAVVPSNEGIPAEYLDLPKRGEIVVKTKPDQPRVLRCTSAIADKQKKFAEYRAKGIIGAGDCTVIAVNICRLSDNDIDGNGISQWPLVMEAVYPIGPLAVPITAEGTLGKAQNAPRLALAKPSGSSVPTGYFLEPAFAGISAIVQAHQRDMYERPLVLTTVHNPLANVSLPHDLFGAYKEYVAEDEEPGYLRLKNIAPARA